MRPYKPGPKSFTKDKKIVTADLGDESVNTSSDETRSETEQPETNATDYGLNFTSSGTRKRTTPAQRKPDNNTPARRRSDVRQHLSRPNYSPSTSRRKQSNPTKNAFRDHKKLIENVNFMIPRLSFARLVREIILSFSPEVTRVTPVALEALQTSTEAYITQRLEDAYLLSLHRGRVTLSIQDMLLIKYLRRFNR